MNAWLIIVSIIVTVLVLCVVGVLLVYFSHRDDKNKAMIPRITVLFGLFLAIISVLCLPFDVVVNSDNLDGDDEINMRLVWEMVFYLIAIWMWAVIPFSFFFYESETDPKKKVSGCGSQLCQAILYTTFFVVVFTMFFVIAYLADHTAHIPYEKRVVNWGTVKQQVSSTTNLVVSTCPDEQCTISDESLDVEMTATVFVIGCCSLVGWFLFCVFAGVGLIALPFDWINEFRTRPKKLSASEYKEKKENIAGEAQRLKNAGKILKDDEIRYLSKSVDRKTKQQHKKDIATFETATYVLKDEWRLIKISYEKNGGNSCNYFAKLFGGCLGIVISLMWILQICLFILPEKPVTPFLNDLFTDLTFDGFSLFGVIAFGFQSFWLFLCVIKGAFRCGLRIPLIMRIYPMEVGGTLMNAFLVNTWILLICSIPTVHFCAQAFPVYARNTEVDLLFGTQIKYIAFFGAFFKNKIFVYVLLIISIISLLYLLGCSPSIKDQVDAEIKELVEKQSKLDQNRLESRKKRVANSV